MTCKSWFFLRKIPSLFWISISYKAQRSHETFPYYGEAPLGATTVGELACAEGQGPRRSASLPHVFLIISETRLKKLFNQDRKSAQSLEASLGLCADTSAMRFWPLDDKNVPTGSRLTLSDRQFLLVPGVLRVPNKLLLS